MRYQIKYEGELAITRDFDPSMEDLAEHFSKNGYDPFFVYKNGLLSYVVTFDDFSSGNIDRTLKRSFIRNYEKGLSGKDIESAFLEDLDAEWLIYVDKGRVVCAVDSLIELPLQNGVAKNLMALRYIHLFHDNLERAFSQYKRIGVLGKPAACERLQKEFPGKRFERFDDLSSAYCSAKGGATDAILDFQYCKRIRKSLGKDSSSFFDLCKVLTGPALDMLVKLAQERGIKLLFYKLPRYQDLACLNAKERENFEHRKKMGRLISDESYMHSYSKDVSEIDFLRRKENHSSQRLDNGYCFVMDDVETANLRVCDGIRSNGRPKPKGLETVYNFYGPCTAYGFLTADDQTVPSFVESYAHKDGKNLVTKNRAGIHGDNELNSLMEAMGTPAASGDAYVFLDVLEDLPKDKYPCFAETKDWFNAEKPEDEVWFLDFPGHCNRAANTMMANHVYADISKIETAQPALNEKRKPLVPLAKDEDFELLGITHSSCIKQMRSLKTAGPLFGRDLRVGAVVLPDLLSCSEGISVIDQCLKQCDNLYVFSPNFEAKDPEEGRRLDEWISKCAGAKIRNAPLERFFDSTHYLTGRSNLGSRLNKAVKIERAFFATILNKLGVSIRFLVEGEPFSLWNRAIFAGSDVFRGEIAKIKCLKLGEYEQN